MTARLVPTPNYGTHEGLCPCGCGLGMADELVICLQAFNSVLRRAWGVPIRHILTSGARCAAHNAKTPKASPTSQHVHGLAVDGFYEMQRSGRWERIDNADVAMAAVKSGIFGGVGYREYARDGRNIVHLDIRQGPCLTW